MRFNVADVVMMLATVSAASVAPRSGHHVARQSGPGDTLQAGWYWVRAVAAPNFHKYVQTKPPNAPGTAILETYRTAGQYNVDGDGQFVANTGSGAEPLYLHVERPADPANAPRKLATWFNTTRNDFGAFAFQGDALTWSDPSVNRQNLAAWLVCEGQAMFINTGAYGYQTPAGCADQTVSPHHRLTFSHNLIGIVDPLLQRCARERMIGQSRERPVPSSA